PGTGHVDGEDVGEVGRRELFQIVWAGEAGDARIVVEDIESPPGVDGGGGKPPAVAVDGDVGPDDQRFDAGPLALGGCLLRFGLARRVVDDGVAAFFREAAGAGGADSRRAAGDDGDRPCCLVWHQATSSPSRTASSAKARKVAPRRSTISSASASVVISGGDVMIQSPLRPAFTRRA